ncbi:MAG TPA: SAF domain-containing protein [Clostridia bacterium]|nr:SAF domain-containing protein [Clostridia bacterium]
MKRFGWIGAALVIVVLLVAAELAIVTNAAGYDKKEKIVFIKADIPAGTLITADMLELRETDSSAVHPDAVGNTGEALGKRPTIDLVEGEMLLKARLSINGRNIAKAADKSKRLFSADLKIDQANGWQFSERQFVDIIYIPNPGEENEQTPQAEGVSIVPPAPNGVRVMKNVRVAGIMDEDGQLTDVAEEGKIPRYVSFEVTQEQAVFLAYAKSNGKLELCCIPGE